MQRWFSVCWPGVFRCGLLWASEFISQSTSLPGLDYPIPRLTNMCTNLLMYVILTEAAIQY